jgi:regulator of nucleoside diphosphate kinase
LATFVISIRRVARCRQPACAPRAPGSQPAFPVPGDPSSMMARIAGPASNTSSVVARRRCASKQIRMQENDMQTMTADRPVGCISALDLERLETLIERTFGAAQPLNSPARAVLQRLRNAGVIARPERIPPGLVTMNSTIRLREEETGRERELTLVYPEDHDPAEACWSVLSPVGAALFGMLVGDSLDLPEVNGTTTRCRIVSLPFQPEAKGFLTM